ncbi:MAG: long-chain fatty acid--CoA ligase [Myxococcales bacterium]|nr:long-chain fatty acid--CoA ligase [Myxococcales bacterium]
MTQETDLPTPEPLPRLFLRRAEQAGDRVASYSKVGGRWVGTTWREGRQAVEEVALGLLELGADKGTPVAILSGTRREWQEADMACLCIGAVTVGIYPTLTPAQARELLVLSGARIVFVEDHAKQVALQEATRDLDPPVRFVTFEREAGPDVMTLAELRRRGVRRRQERPEELVRRIQALSPSDVVSYIYTSGTTGEPKGAMLTHANFHYVIHATNSLIPYDGETALVFLPLAHSLQRYTNYLALISSANGYYAESLDKVQENLREVRPTVFTLVPRVLEKIHTKAMAAGMDTSPVRQRVFTRSMGILREVGKARRDHGVPALGARLLHRVADQMVAAKIRERMGGRVKFIGSGGAPLAREVHEFFEDIGVPILEGYGLTETCAPACINTLETRRVGTVGRPMPGTEVKIAEDGEILVRGPGVFIGYHDNAQATREAFGDTDWFHTGDIGYMSRDGFLTITDRKKDIIITAGGKNVAPQPLEGALRRHPYVGQAVLLGDRQPYLTALVGLDPEAAAQLAEAHGLPAHAPPEQVAAIPEVKAALDAHLAAVNAERPSFEQIKKIEILPEELSIENGALTPTLKVKRRVVAERYRDKIQGLYAS